MVGDRLRASNTDDACNIFGKNVAAKLRTLPKETRLYTEKIINDLLFNAEMGNVNKDTRIITATNTTIQSAATNIVSTYQPRSYPYMESNEYHLPTATTSEPIHSTPQSENTISSFFINYEPIEDM